MGKILSRDYDAPYVVGHVLLAPRNSKTFRMLISITMGVIEVISVMGYNI
jgi:hypothetical protein